MIKCRRTSQDTAIIQYVDKNIKQGQKKNAFFKTFPSLCISTSAGRGDNTSDWKSSAEVSKSGSKTCFYLESFKHQLVFRISYPEREGTVTRKGRSPAMDHPRVGGNPAIGLHRAGGNPALMEEGRSRGSQATNLAVSGELLVVVAAAPVTNLKVSGVVEEEVEIPPTDRRATLEEAEVCSLLPPRTRARLGRRAA